MTVTFAGNEYDLEDRDQRIDFGFKRWNPMMQNMASRLSNSVCDKDDLMQEAYMKIIRSADKWDPNRPDAATFETYIFSAIRNGIIEAAQRSRFAMSIPSGSIGSVDNVDTLKSRRLDVDIPDDRGDPNNFMDICDAIEQFDHYRIAQMYFIEKRTIQEISSMIGSSRSSVARKLCSIKSMLKNKLSV